MRGELKSFIKASIIPLDTSTYTYLASPLAILVKLHADSSYKFGKSSLDRYKINLGVRFTSINY